MRVVHKFRFPLTDKDFYIPIGICSKIVLVSAQDGAATMWVERWDLKEVLPNDRQGRRFRIFGTGMTIPEDAIERGNWRYEHVGSWIQRAYDSDLYVWHLYEDIEREWDIIDVMRKNENS